MTAEQFMDAVWMLTKTAPAKPAAPVRLPEFAESVPPERRFIRASLVTADELMRTLGRPNREQVRHHAARPSLDTTSPRPVERTGPRRHPGARGREPAEGEAEGDAGRARRGHLPAGAVAAGRWRTSWPRRASLLGFAGDGRGARGPAVGGGHVYRSFSSSGKPGGAVMRFAEQVGKLSDEQRLAFYEVLAHNLTISIRGICRTGSISDAKG